MGGVGKTTLARKIKNRVMTEDVFAESVMVVVSQHADMEKIQGDIAGQLSLKFEETSLSSRAQRLCTRLTVDGKRRLVVLDDVWEPLKLEDLGIPCNRSECTILLTSRVKSVFTRMDIDEANILVVQTLTEEEAWSLFKEKVGACAEEFSSLAQDIANECNGLPLALVTLAGALKQEKNISVWEDALKQLRHSNPEDLTDVLEGVYYPLKLSYDYLSSSNAKSIFLLCSLFPEDYFIQLQDLSAYAMGLHLFRGLETLEEVRDRTVSVIGNLKSRFLLLDDYHEDFFSMHDVIRDVAIHIASNEVQLTNCGYNSTWISPFIGGGERIELSNGSTFPNLRLLMIEGNQMQISDDIFLKGKEQLNVLSITSNSSITSLQLTTKNLKTLIIKDCDSLKTICCIVELVNLEILICHGCNAIEEFLPLETLECLKFLEIVGCEVLKKIGSAGVMSDVDKKKLVSKLDTLYLHALPNLTVFCQDIETIEFPLLTDLRIQRCEQLKWLVSSSQGSMGDDDDDDNDDDGHSLHLLCNQKVLFGKLMKVVIENIMNSNNLFCSSQIPIDSFTHLQAICLQGLPKLKTFCSSTLWLPKLKNLGIVNCPEFGGINLGSLTATNNLESLETLQICSCEKIEQVFLWSEEENEKEKEFIGQSSTPHPRHITFPKLIYMALADLPRLKNVWKGAESVEFPLLSEMTIKDCPNQKSLVSISGDNNKAVEEPRVYFSLSIRDLTFTNLGSLAMHCFGEVSSLFSSSVAANLINLRCLKVGGCKSIVKVIEEGPETAPLFPLLWELKLLDLPELKLFCELKCDLELPLLDDVHFKGCPKMDRFNLGSLTTPKLKTVMIEAKKITIEGDLNDVLQRVNREQVQDKGKAE